MNRNTIEQLANTMPATFTIDVLDEGGPGLALHVFNHQSSEPLFQVNFSATGSFFIEDLVKQSTLCTKLRPELARAIAYEGFVESKEPVGHLHKPLEPTFGVSLTQRRENLTMSMEALDQYGLAAAIGKEQGYGYNLIPGGIRFTKGDKTVRLLQKPAELLFRFVGDDDDLYDSLEAYLDFPMELVTI